MTTASLEFFSHAPSYYSDGDLLRRKENTLSIDAAHRVISNILPGLDENHAPTAHDRVEVFDIAGGTGYFSILLASRHARVNTIVFDKSPAMMRVGHQYLLERLQGVRDRVHFLQGDAHRLPVKTNSATCALLFCAMHLLEPVTVIANAYRLLAPNGQLHVLTWRPENLIKTMYHSFFPKYAEIDIPRYQFAHSLAYDLRSAGFQKITEIGIAYRIHYETVEEVMAVARRRPFSTFAYYSADDLAAALPIFEGRLRERFGFGPVVNEAEMTLISAQK